MGKKLSSPGRICKQHWEPSHQLSACASAPMTMLQPLMRDQELDGERCFRYTPIADQDNLDVLVATEVLLAGLPQGCFGDFTLQRIAAGKYRLGEQKLFLKQLEDGSVHVRQGGKFVPLVAWLRAEAQRVAN